VKASPYVPGGGFRHKLHSQRLHFSFVNPNIFGNSWFYLQGPCLASFSLEFLHNVLLFVMKTIKKKKIVAALAFQIPSLQNAFLESVTSQDHH